MLEAESFATVVRQCDRQNLCDLQKAPSQRDADTPARGIGPTPCNFALQNTSSLVPLYSIFPDYTVYWYPYWLGRQVACTMSHFAGPNDFMTKCVTQRGRGRSQVPVKRRLLQATLRLCGRTFPQIVSL